MYKYITQTTIDWLLEKDDVEIRYLFAKEFPTLCKNIDLKTEKSNLQNSIMHNQNYINANNGIIGDSKHFDLLYKGTVWNFAVFVEKGLTVLDSNLRKTADFIISNLQLKSGGFTLDWKPKVESASFTGDILYYLLKSNYNENSIHKTAKWLIENQRHDGGWLYSSLSGITDSLKLILFRKSGKGINRENILTQKSCIVTTFCCLRALVLYQKKFNLFKENISKGIEFLFNSEILNKEHVSSIDGFCENKNIYKFGYPVISQVDVLSLLLLFAQAGYFNDIRIGKAFNTIIEKRNFNGSWNYESKSAGMIYNLKQQRKKTNKPDKWITLNAIRLMMYAENKSN